MSTPRTLIYLAMLALLAISGPAASDPAIIKVEKLDQPHDVTLHAANRTADGGLITLGRRLGKKPNRYEGVASKHSATGSELWRYRYKHAEDHVVEDAATRTNVTYDEHLTHVVSSPDGGYIFAGLLRTSQAVCYKPNPLLKTTQLMCGRFGEGYTAIIIRVDRDGQEIWRRHLLQPSLSSLVMAGDGIAIGAGPSLVRMSLDGEELDRVDVLAPFPELMRIKFRMGEKESWGAWSGFDEHSYQARDGLRQLYIHDGTPFPGWGLSIALNHDGSVLATSKDKALGFNPHFRTQWLSQYDVLNALGLPAPAGDGEGWFVFGSTPKSTKQPLKWVVNRFILRIDADGKEMWRRPFDSDHLGPPTRMEILPNGRLLVFGQRPLVVGPRTDPTKSIATRWLQILSDEGHVIETKFEETEAWLGFESDAAGSVTVFATATIQPP